jgi:hypothetical protein
LAQSCKRTRAFSNWSVCVSDAMAAGGADPAI